MTSEINNSTSSVQKAIELKKEDRENASKREIASFRNTLEASGDNPNTTSISTSIDTSTSKAENKQGIEEAFETILPATSSVKNSKDTDEKQKKEAEKTNKEIEENNQKIIASWTSQGGKTKDEVS